MQLSNHERTDLVIPVLLVHLAVPPHAAVVRLHPVPQFALQGVGPRIEKTKPGPRLQGSKLVLLVGPPLVQTHLVPSVIPE